MSRAFSTQPVITLRILEATIRSSSVDYNGGTVKSRIMRHARINHKELERRLSILVEQGLLSKEQITLHDWPHQAARVWPKRRAKAMRVIYKLTDKGHEYLHNEHQQEQDKHQLPIDETTLRPIKS
ncbi:MAG: winged helix-turn-helix domain-containing protein [Thermoproteota archaeon]|nr:winged helix-turn-helix domain-containing protein [Thermoproteota archaeon]